MIFLYSPDKNENNDDVSGSGAAQTTSRDQSSAFLGKVLSMLEVSAFNQESLVLLYTAVKS